MNIGFKLLEGFPLGEASRQSRDFGPKSSLFSFMNNGFKRHGKKIAILAEGAISDSISARIPSVKEVERRWREYPLLNFGNGWDD